MPQPEASVGVIGGSGLYDIEGLTGVREVDADTPFGKPSDRIIVGNLEGVSVAFLPRHGRGHRLLPTEVPYLANIYALKALGVGHIISVNAVGSLQDALSPGEMVIPDQLIDRTRLRRNTFFGEGIVGHIPFAEPFCPVTREVLYRTAKEAGVRVHDGGTCVVMEGPAFSTRAESFLYRSWGADIIGMTLLPEAKLAREAEICYAALANVTDYDCWHEDYASVTAEMIISTLKKNVAAAREVIRRAVKALPKESDCGCASALELGLVTSPDAAPAAAKKKLKLLTGKYWKSGLE
ncbi:MAG: S-methyl-5'-thioadenosine phosphorylase [Chloroflexota bacterium]